MEHFEQLALDSAKKNQWYVGYTCIVWLHGLDTLSEFFSYINSLWPSLQFIMEIEANNMINFLYVLVTRKESALTTKVYREPIHTSCCLNSVHLM
jgi:hypothetical protein